MADNATSWGPRVFRVRPLSAKEVAERQLAAEREALETVKDAVEEWRANCREAE